MNSTVVEFTDISLDITWRQEGRHHVAGIYSPSERPFPVVERCFLQCGDFRVACIFEELREELQETALETLEAEIEEYTTPSYEEA